jgi:drug/metabolite transporter, DME family
MTASARGILYVVGAALLWSAGGVGIKAVQAGPLTVACVRSAVAAVALWLWFRPRLGRVTPALVGGVVAAASCVTTFVIATKWTSAANAIFLQYSGVVWVLLLAPRLLGEPRRGEDFVAVAVAFGGMALFFVGELTPGDLAGNLVAVLSGVCYAGLVLALRHQRDDAAPAVITWGNALTAVALAPFAMPDRPLPAASLAILLLLGTFQLGLAYVLFVRGLRDVPAVQASLVGMLEPVANPIWVFLLLGDAPRPSAVAGGVVVLGAIAWRTVAVERAVAGAVPLPD